MNCYKGKCFCIYYVSCKNGRECDRALTLEVLQDASKTELSIDRYTSKPECYEVKK